MYTKILRFLSFSRFPENSGFGGHFWGFLGVAKKVIFPPGKILNQAALCGSRVRWHRTDAW